MAGSQSNDYQPTAEMLPIINAQYNMAMMTDGNKNADLMRLNRISLLVIASKSPYYAIRRAICSARNQLDQIVSDDYRASAIDLINQLEMTK